MTLEKLHERPGSLKRRRLISSPIGREKPTQNCWLHLNLHIRRNLVRPRGRIFLYWGRKTIEVIALAVSEVSFLVGLFARPSTCHCWLWNISILHSVEARGQNPQLLIPSDVIQHHPLAPGWAGVARPPPPFPWCPGSHSASWECGSLLTGRFLLPHHTREEEREAGETTQKNKMF